MKRHTFLSALIILFLPVILHSQTVFHSHPLTVMEARRLPNGSSVTLTGNIVNYLPGRLDYTFRDSSGEILVRIEQRIWRGMYIGVSDIVEISGVVRVNWGLVTINAEFIDSIGPTSIASVTPPVTASQPVAASPPIAANQPITVGRSITVREARGLPHDSWVVVTGNIVEALPGGRTYAFRDSTGDIIVELDSRIWWRFTIGTSDIVELSGEIIEDRGMVTLNAKAIRIWPNAGEPSTDE